jgi:hypothetical protein
VKTLDEIKELLIKHKKKIRDRFKAEVIGIFGSYVRGEQKEGSDIDVLVKFDEGATLFELVGLSIYLEEILGVKKVDVIPYDAIREEIKDKIFKEMVYI